jgi:mono/diheme cytochrome c family protein
MKYQALFQKILVWALIPVGLGIISLWWAYLPPNLPDIPQEGKAERAIRLELVMAGLSKQTEENEDATDAIPAETSPRSAKIDTSGTPETTKKVNNPTAGLAKKDVQPQAEQVQLDPMVKLGIKVYKEFECFNCHKIAGKGNKKRKGPELDNIGNLVSAEMMKKKMLDPFVFSTEGFEKEYQKPVMPNNYPKLMTEKEMDAVVAYMMTLKNPGAKTPKPIFDVKRPDL